MTRRKKYRVEDIVDAAVEIVRQRGMGNLSARALAHQLKASTMPIYTRVNSMRDIEEAVVENAWQRLLSFQLTPYSGDIYMDMGLGYVLFARNEKYLFKCIHDETYSEVNTRCSADNFEYHLKRLRDYPVFDRFSDESRRKFMFHGWLFSHGFASLLNSGMESYIRSLESDSAIREVFTEASAIFWKGLKALLDRSGYVSAPSGNISPHDLWDRIDFSFIIEFRPTIGEKVAHVVVPDRFERICFEVCDQQMFNIARVLGQDITGRADHQDDPGKEESLAISPHRVAGNDKHAVVECPGPHVAKP